MIAATFYSNERGEEETGKLLSNAVIESRDCIPFNVCSAVSGEMMESYTKTCMLLELVEEDDIVDQLALNTTRLMLRKQCCEIRNHPYWKWFFICTPVNHIM